MDDLYQLLRENGIELESKFRKSSIEGRGTSQEVADFREHAVQEFVERFLQVWAMLRALLRAEPAKK